MAISRQVIGAMHFSVHASRYADPSRSTSALIIGHFTKGE